MTITTEFLLRSPSLPLINIAKSLPNNEMECVHGLQLQEGIQMFVVQINHPGDVSEDNIRALDEVVEMTTLGRTSDKLVYKFAVEIDESLARIFNPERFDGAPMEPPTIMADGWHEVKIFKNHDAFDRFRTSCQKHDISLELISITSDQSRSDTQSEYGLTDRQREALMLALSRGYYESPRQTSTEELAEELNIAQSSVSGLLRRAERRLLSSALGTREHLNTLSTSH
jgi:predicted DNA binding protein